MGLLPQIILGALLIVAFALSAHQRLAIASHTGPMPARQIAYLMRAHHQAAIAMKLADPALDTVVNAAPPTMMIPNDFTFLSCIHGKIVTTAAFVIGDTTTLMTLPIFPPAEANEVVAELRRQSFHPPELAPPNHTPWAAGYYSSPQVLNALATPGIGLSNEIAAGPLPITCLAPSGVPTIITQVLP